MIRAMEATPPPSSRSVLSEALRHHQAGRLAEAEALYGRILAAEPGHIDALHFLGVLAHQRGRHELAVELIRKAIAGNARVPAFHLNLGNALKAQGDLAGAAAAYHRALRLDGGHAGALYNLALVHQAAGRLAPAAESYRALIARNPGHVEAHLNLGNVLHAQGHAAEASTSYARALELRPDYVEARVNLGNAQRSLGLLTEAVGSYGRALELAPGSAEAHHNLAIVQLQRGHLRAAEDACRRAVEHRPGYAEGWVLLGNALREQGRGEEAAHCYRRALAVEAENADARLGLALATIPPFVRTAAASAAVAQDFGRALEDLASWCGAHPGSLGRAAGSAQPFYLAYRPGDATQLLQRYGDLVAGEAAGHWRDRIAGLEGPHAVRERIRLVIVSGQVRRHPAWDVLLRGIVAHLDRARFEVIVYHTASLADEETAWARARVDRFVQGPKPLAAWLHEVREDRPDVIFHPEVGMDPAGCAMAALRLAPLQVAGWGHPVTTGFPCMDLYVSGELIEPPDGERHYREKLIRLPGTGVCTERAFADGPRESEGHASPDGSGAGGETSASRSWHDPGRVPGVVRFTICQQPIKLDPADDALLARIVKQAGACELWLVSPGKLEWTAGALRERLAGALRAEGVAPEAHLRATPWMGAAEFDRFLDSMDVYLDCPAFSGYTTAWQAVHRGMPIVTLEGGFMRQRLAAGLARQIGITDGVAASAGQYVEAALRLAEESRDASRRAERRAAIRAAAPRADANLAAVRAFERALIEALRDRRRAATCSGT
jgi:predicted O-linked N-acetylglucosamine transferase (SPINDLY family)